MSTHINNFCTDEKVHVVIKNPARDLTVELLEEGHELYLKVEERGEVDSTSIELSNPNGCDWCGSLRLNGTTVRKTDDGYVEDRNYNPAAENQSRVCRNCAMRALGW